MLEKISEIIKEQLSIGETVITEETNFIDDLGVDSLDFVELAMAFEEEYNIEIDSGELEGLATVGDVMKYLKSKSED